MVNKGIRLNACANALWVIVTSMQEEVMAYLSTEEDQQQFIIANVKQLSRAAYAGYRDLGRGILVVLPDEQDEQLGGLSVLQFHYMLPSDLIEVVENLIPDETRRKQTVFDIWQQVAVYDPEANVVITFLHEGAKEKGLTFYRVECPTPPAVAYAAFTN